MMFGWLKSRFSKPQQASQESVTTWVYIWNMTRDGPGHVAIQVGGNKPKINKEDEGEYMSLHPCDFPSMGITSVLPLPAATAETLTEDTEAQAVSDNPVFDQAGLVMHGSRYQALSPLKPSQTIQLKHLDTRAMLQRIQTIKEGVETGATCYQLFPNVDVARLLNEAPIFISQDPVDVMVSQTFFSRNMKRAIQPHNCATLVGDILKTGGVDVKISSLPWGITPDGLGSQINSASK